MYTCCRGNTFRRAFSELGVLRSLVPGNVKVMALTATATKLTQKAVCRSLGMISPVIVPQVSNRPNIKYCVNNNTGTLSKHLPLLSRKYDRDAQEWTKLLCIADYIMIAVQ